MQFYLDGFRDGDPEIQPRSDGVPAGSQGPLPDEVDVLIVGAGPAGSVLAAQLSQFPSINTRLVERRPARMSLGQADGLACRTVEMLNTFGIAHRVMREAYWVNETVFWGPGSEDPGKLVCTARMQDVEDGLSEFPHLIVNQARLQDYLVDHMRRSPRRLEPDFGLEVTAVEVSETPGDPVTVRMRRTAGPDDGDEVTVRARYVVGCDGARSVVRSQIGRELKGDPQDHVWGVMDVFPVTDFPDVRYKCIIQAPGTGTVGIIPREGGYMIRLYIDMGSIPADDREYRNKITLDDILTKARSVFAPYSFEAKQVPWWSAYEVGQRLADVFDNIDEVDRGARPPQVFIAGDACHTHSAKAGQGMNVSMQDAFNLGWKLAAVLEGRSPESLLDSYTGERQPIADELIQFDRHHARIVSGEIPDENGLTGPVAVHRQHVKAARFTAGVATHYPPGLLIGNDTHQGLAAGFAVGTRFHSAPVIRVADAKSVHLGHTHVADGRWRIYAFSDEGEAALAALCEWLVEAPDSPIRRFSEPGADLDSIIDVRGIYQRQHREITISDVPSLLRPTKGALGLTDYEKAFTSDVRDGTDVFDLREIDRRKGCIVVVRPDQYVAQVLPLEARAELTDFFAAFMCPKDR